MSAFENVCEDTLKSLRRHCTGEIVAPGEIAVMRSHLARCETCKTAAAIILAQSLRKSSVDDMDDLTRHRYIDGILDQAAAPVVPEPSSRRMRSVVGIAAAVLLAVSLWFLFLHRSGEQTTEPPAYKSEPAAALQVVEKSEEPEPLPEADDEKRFTATSTSSVLSLPTGIEVLLEPGGRLALGRVDRSIIEVKLTEGTLFAQVAPERRGPQFRVKTASGTVAVKGTIFSVRVTERTASVYVLRGTVEATTPKGTQSVGAMGAYALDRDAPVSFTEETRAELRQRLALLRDAKAHGVMRVDLQYLLPHQTKAPAHKAPMREQKEPKNEVPTIEALLDEAGRARKAQHWDAAVDLYKEMMRLYPDEKASQHAEVALGNLLLDKLHQPKDALRHFERYLHRGDTALAEEALFGKARALRSLRRSAEEKAALTEYVERFPRAMNIDVARERLGE